MSRRFVYVVGVATNPVKIGLATNVPKRVANLQIGCPDRLVVHAAVPISAGLAGAVESAAHRRFSEFWRHGEWFNIEAETATAAVRLLAREAMCGAAYSLPLEDATPAYLRLLGGATHPYAEGALDAYRHDHHKGDPRAAAAEESVLLAAGELGLWMLRQVFLAGGELSRAINHANCHGGGSEDLRKAVAALADAYIAADAANDDELGPAARRRAKLDESIARSRAKVA
jgi:hypothetical protein